MAILRYIIFMFLATALTSCFEEFSPAVDTKPVLCLNSLITAGEPIEVSVTHTWMYNDQFSEYDHNVSDAEVTIIANGETVGPGYLPEEGDRIRIVAESPTYGTATADVTVPQATPVGKVKFTPIVTDLWIGDPDFYGDEMLADIEFNLNVEVDIDDPAGTDNYYKIEYSRYDFKLSDYPSDYTDPFGPRLSLGYLDYDSEPIFKEHIGAFESVMGSGDESDFTFFTDRQFSGKTYTLHLNFTPNYFKINNRTYDESLLECGVIINLISVSESYYNWSVYKWNVDDGFLDTWADFGLAESKWGYSNVSTGAGVVAARSTASCAISLKDFLKQTFNFKQD